MNRILASSLAMLSSGIAHAQNPPAFLVSSRFTNQVLAYDTAGGFAGVFAQGGGLVNPVGISYGPDGNLYVVSANSNQILSYDAGGMFLGVFAQGLNAPRNLTFGPDGNLYVCNAGTSQVLRFHRSGAPMGAFAQGTAIAANTSMTFGPDFNLYVGSVTRNQVVRFDGVSGAMLGVFASTNMNGTHDLSFGPDGHLYVSNAFANNEVRRYDGTTGALLGVFVTPGSGGLNAPLFTTFVRDPSGMQLSLSQPASAGQNVTFVTTGAWPGAVLGLGIGTSAGPFPLPCPALFLGIANPAVLGTASADEAGRGVLRAFAPPGIVGLTFLFQAVDFTGCSTSAVLHVPF